MLSCGCGSRFEAPPAPNGPVPVGQAMPDLPDIMADDLDMTPRGHVNEEDRDEFTSGANNKIRVCAPQDENDVESLVTGLPKDLLLLVLSRGQEIMAEREANILSCHGVDDLLGWRDWMGNTKSLKFLVMFPLAPFLF